MSDDDIVILSMIDKILNGRRPYYEERKIDDPYMCHTLRESENMTHKGKTLVKKINPKEVKSFDSKTS